MFQRPLWLDKIKQAWKRRSIVWLSGVRRVGKTTLANMLPDAVYMNCDLPSVVRSLEDPELFLSGQPTDKVLILDEVHRLDDPSGLLKIAADLFPGVRILATGSSTLAATRKFRDSLTGRKQAVHLGPVLWEESPDPFGINNLNRRLLHGGLPEALLARRKEPEFFNEWIDSFFARDIQELFGVRNRQGFLTLFRLLLRQSGGQLDYTNLAKRIELISRPTTISHLEAMQISHAMHLVRPFHSGSQREIVARPKCYAFDTGFVSFEKGWDTIRDDDRGLLWEHLVLDTLRFLYADDNLFYWRDKSHREVDFVIRRSRKQVDAIECKINPDRLNATGIQAFRQRYPEGKNFVAVPLARKPYQIRRKGLLFTVCTPRDLA